MTQGPTSALPTTRNRLSHDEVARKGLAIADSEGVDALTMRHLAEGLGVGTMTLYGYFPSKRELLDAVVRAAVTESEIHDAGGDWRARLRELVVATRRLLVLHPSLVEIRTRHPVVVPDALRLTEQAMQILLDAGFDKSEAALAFRLLFVYSFGFAALSPADTEETAKTTAREGLSALSPDEYPALAGLVDEAVGAMGGDEVFRFGLERILDGLEVRLAA